MEYLKYELRPGGVIVWRLYGAQQIRQLIYLQSDQLRARLNYWRWFRSTSWLNLFLGRPQAIEMLLELQFL